LSMVLRGWVKTSWEKVDCRQGSSEQDTGKTKAIGAWNSIVEQGVQRVGENELRDGRL
jgi:hypothetical protein